MVRRRSLTTDLPSSKDSPTIGLRLTGLLHREDQGPFPAKGIHAHGTLCPRGLTPTEGVIGMSAVATPIGITAQPVSYPERGIGRQDWTRFASGSRGERETKHRAAVANTLQWADEAAACGDHFDAVAWLDTVEAIGDELSEVYKTRRASWCAQLGRLNRSM